MTCMTTVDEHEQRASAFLATIRQTPMIRSNPKHALEPLWDGMTAVFVGEAVLPRLAKRIAMQLVVKIEASELGQRRTWRAIARHLVRETEQLRAGIRLVDRQIVVALPKLSADDIEALLDSLTRREPDIARTILNAAL